MKARTLFRVGKYDFPEDTVGEHGLPIEDVVRKFRLPMQRADSLPGGEGKYHFIRRGSDGLYVQFSIYKNPADTRPYKHNVFLMVASFSNQTNREIADQFERETGISLKLEVPEELERASKLISRALDMN